MPNEFVPQRILLLSRKPLIERPLHEWLAEVVTDTVLVTVPGALADIGADVRGRFRDCRTVSDYQSWSTEWTAECAAREHRVGLVASSSEDDVLRSARLRDRLGLPGQTLESARAYRDKLIMKDTAARAGVKVPRRRAIDRPTDLMEFTEEVGLPVVVKPRRGSASIGVRILRGRSDVTAFLASGELPAAPQCSGRWIAEEYIEGDFFHVDGVIADAAVVHCWPSQYNSGNAEAAQTESELSSVLLAPDDPRTCLLQRFAADVHRALPTPAFPTSFHLEAWIPAHGRPVLCEVAARTGGALIARTYREAFGVHLSRENLRGQCGLGLELTHQPAAPRHAGGWVLFPPGHGRFEPPTGACPVAGTEVELHMPAGAFAHGPEYAAHSAAAVAVHADTAEQVRERIRETTRWWTEEARWLN
ncbi:acetyl-CoA carboxylase biotin carboxylase subunit family protein [Nocardia sp. NPDC049526]|uniref:acetyl-CoA carboxylase biotin carboxylase subunit family protein n=1 Tax=Nocardia sp. NPDC049526 TaxID=3364316 RepID=UPI0037B90338